MEVTMNEHVQTAATEPLFNPLSPDFIRDPYPHYERLRTTDPMHVNAHRRVSWPAATPMSAS